MGKVRGTAEDEGLLELTATAMALKMVRVARELLKIKKKYLKY